MTDIIVVGYPKSGNTWLSRMLGDLYDCPVTGLGTAVPLCTEGLDRESPHVVRQLHLKVANSWDRPEYNWEAAVCNAWWFGYDLWDPTKHKIVHIMRDPRDVAVSVWHYWNRERLWDAIDAILYGTHPLKMHGAWHHFVEGWLGVPVPTVKYERLIVDAVGVLKAIAAALDIEPVNDPAKVVRRQSFTATKDRIAKTGNDLPYGKAVQDHNLRKGIVGDWSNHWTMQQGEIVGPYWDDLLLTCGWESNPDWAKEIK